MRVLSSVPAVSDDALKLMLDILNFDDAVIDAIYTDMRCITNPKNAGTQNINLAEIAKQLNNANEDYRISYINFTKIINADCKDGHMKYRILLDKKTKKHYVDEWIIP